MYRLFIANKNYSSWSLRPWVLMRELGIGFTEHNVRFEAASNWAKFRDFSPNGQVPCLHDGDTVVWDSLGITLYLADRHEGIWPLDERARSWAACAVTEMHAGFAALRNLCGMNCGLRIELPSLPEDVRRDLTRIDELWREGFDRFGGPFLAGPAFTAADAFFAPIAFRAQTYALPFSDVGQGYIQRLLGLPSMLAWYEDAIAETFRDDLHEVEARATGRITADVRMPAIG